MPAIEFVAPNLYDLSGRLPGGHTLHVTYSTRGFDGKPHLSYQDGTQGLSFSGDQIRVVEADIGMLVSVTIRMTVDTGSTSFSVLIPRVNLPAGPGQSAPIASDGITTVHRFSVLPMHGQLDLYSVVKLSGTARFVVF
jgi:hypothetical protein